MNNFYRHLAISFWSHCSQGTNQILWRKVDFKSLWSKVQHPLGLNFPIWFFSDWSRMMQLKRFCRIPLLWCRMIEASQFVNFKAKFFWRLRILALPWHKYRYFRHFRVSTYFESSNNTKYFISQDSRANIWAFILPY